MQNNLIIATAVFSALAFSAPSANAVSLKYPFGKNKILPGYKPFIKPFHNNNLDVTIEKLLGSHPWKTLGYTAIVVGGVAAGIYVINVLPSASLLTGYSSTAGIQLGVSLPLGTVGTVGTTTVTTAGVAGGIAAGTAASLMGDKQSEAPRVVAFQDWSFTMPSTVNLFPKPTDLAVTAPLERPISMPKLPSIQVGGVLDGAVSGGQISVIDVPIYRGTQLGAIVGCLSVAGSPNFLFGGVNVSVPLSEVRSIVVLGGVGAGAANVGVQTVRLDAGIEAQVHGVRSVLEFSGETTSLPDSHWGLNTRLNVSLPLDLK